jgi:hypothetical protein
MTAATTNMAGAYLSPDVSASMTDVWPVALPTLHQWPLLWASPTHLCHLHHRNIFLTRPTPLMAFIRTPTLHSRLAAHSITLVHPSASIPTIRSTDLRNMTGHTRPTKWPYSRDTTHPMGCHMTNPSTRRDMGMINVRRTPVVIRVRILKGKVGIQAMVPLLVGGITGNARGRLWVLSS